jgi:hypothetical protein
MQLFQETKMSHEDIETCFDRDLSPKIEQINPFQIAS